VRDGVGAGKLGKRLPARYSLRMPIPNFQLATVIAGLIAAAVAIGTLMWQRLKDTKTLRHALYAELRHIRQHYGFAGPGLLGPESAEIKKQLKFGKFGELLTVKDLSRYAILGPAEMQLLLQISFRIRNTDLLIDILLADASCPSRRDLDELRDRMKYVRDSANELIEYIERQDSGLRSIAEPG
jgi:hypothetical protein